MKAVILAGGLGTRLSEETTVKPKPMVEVGGMPILWHIMKLYSHFGINDFIICLGYKGYIIKEFFSAYFLHTTDVTFDLQNNTTHFHESKTEPWKVTLIDTGKDTMTGGRLKRVAQYIGDEDFCFTYGDGVSDVDIGKLVAHHKRSGRLATVTSIQPPGRYGAIRFENDLVRSFEEKPSGDGSWINGGFFVLNPKVINYIENDTTIWEKAPMENLAGDGQMGVFFHHGFWQAMDTLRDMNKLNDLWNNGQAQWKLWK